MEIQKPIISDFTLAPHDHSSAAMGGTLSGYAGPTGSTGPQGNTGAGTQGPTGPQGSSGGGSISLTASYIAYGSSGNTITGTNSFIFNSTGGLPLVSIMGSIKIGKGTSTFSPSDGYGLINSISGNAGFTMVQNSNTAYTSLDLCYNNGVTDGWSIQLNDPGSDPSLFFYDRISYNNMLSIAQGTGNVTIYGSVNINQLDYTWPSAQGGSGYVLTNTDGNGTLAWIASGGGGGSATVSLTSTYIGYGDVENLLDGDAGFIRQYDPTTGYYYGIAISDEQNGYPGTNIFIGIPGSPAGNANAINNYSQYNVGIGGNSLYNITSNSDYNVFIGYNAGVNISSGNQNVGIGFGSLASNNTGNNLVAIGYGADVNSDGYIYSIGLGSGASITASNQFAIASLANPITQWLINGIPYTWTGIVAFFDLTNAYQAPDGGILYTNPDPSNAHTYRVGCYVTITESGIGSGSITVTYTDENSITQTQTFYTTTGFTGTIPGTSAAAFTLIPMDIRVGPSGTIAITNSITAYCDIGATIQFMN